jgi:YggT family protein
MMPQSLNNGLLFLINTLFDMYLFVLIARIILACVGANYFDPLTQFVVRLTNWIVVPIRRYIPNIKRIEVSTILIAFMISILKFLITYLIAMKMPNLLGVGILACGDILKIAIQCFFYAILIQAIMSWVQPGSSMQYVLYQFTSPVTRPLQRIVPRMGAIDITPMFALIGLQLLLIVVINPIMTAGFSLAINS